MRETYCLTALEAGSLKSDVRRSMLSQILSPGKDPSLPLPSFWWWRAILGDLWLIAFTPISACISVSHSLCMCLCPNFSHFTRIPVFGLGPTLTQQDLISTWLHYTYFQIRSHSQVPGVRTWTYFWGDTIQPTTINNDVFLEENLLLFLQITW